MHIIYNTYNQRYFIQMENYVIIEYLMNKIEEITNYEQLIVNELENLIVNNLIENNIKYTNIELKKDDFEIKLFFSKEYDGCAKYFSSQNISFFLKISSKNIATHFAKNKKTSNDDFYSHINMIYNNYLMNTYENKKYGSCTLSELNVKYSELENIVNEIKKLFDFDKNLILIQLFRYYYNNLNKFININNLQISSNEYKRICSMIEFINNKHKIANTLNLKTNLLYLQFYLSQILGFDLDMDLTNIYLNENEEKLIKFENNSMTIDISMNVNRRYVSVYQPRYIIRKINKITNKENEQNENLCLYLDNAIKHIDFCCENIFEFLNKYMSLIFGKNFLI